LLRIFRVREEEEEEACCGFLKETSWPSNSTKTSRLRSAAKKISAKMVFNAGRALLC